MLGRIGFSWFQRLWDTRLVFGVESQEASR